MIVRAFVFFCLCVFPSKDSFDCLLNVVFNFLIFFSGKRTGQQCLFCSVKFHALGGYQTVPVILDRFGRFFPRCKRKGLVSYTLFKGINDSGVCDFHAQKV